MGDHRDLMDRIKARRPEIFDQPAKRYLQTGTAATILGIDSAGRSFDERAAAYTAETLERFQKVFEDEAEAQWDRIIDRRMANWFFSGVLSFAIGFAVGKIT